MSIFKWRIRFFRTTGQIHAKNFYNPDSDPIQPEVQPWQRSNPEPTLSTKTYSQKHPVDRLADAELAYENWQLQNGREVFERGFGPQDASELQNLMAFRQNQGITRLSDDSSAMPFQYMANFHQNRSPGKSMSDMEQGFIQVDSDSDLGFVAPPDIDEHGDFDKENIETAKNDEAQAPLPDPRGDPCCPMNPFDPMDPMSMGEPPEF